MSSYQRCLYTLLYHFVITCIGQSNFSSGTILEIEKESRCGSAAQLVPMIL